MLCISSITEIKDFLSHLTENIKWTYRNRAKHGIFIAQPGRYFGYNTDNGRFTPDENTKYVRMIYEWYAEGKSQKAIADELRHSGIMTTRGNLFTVDAVKGVLSNEVYVGDVHCQKTPSVDVITGKPDKEQIDSYLENHHTAIVSRELWNAAQDRLNRNAKRISDGDVLRRNILRLMDSNEAITISMISKELDISVENVKYHISEMRKQGLVERKGNNRKGVWIAKQKEG